MCILKVSPHCPIVCVTGANGFLGSNIVKQCLQAGYRVRGTVRNAEDVQATKHLRSLSGASTHLELFSALMGPENSTGFDDAVRGCTAVIHTASPARGKYLSCEDVHSAVFGTLAILRACNRAGVKTVVMTSAMCAATSSVDGAVIHEENEVDPRIHVESGNRFAASKILAETAAWELVREEKPDFRFVTILPSCIVGPSLRGDVGFTNRCLGEWMKQGFQSTVCPNASVSFIDVRDCAALHITAMEKESAQGRYLSAASSMHCNDVAALLKEVNPKIPIARPCAYPCEASLIDRTRQDSLGVKVREIREILWDMKAYFSSGAVKDALSLAEDTSHGCSVRVDGLSFAEVAPRRGTVPLVNDFRKTVPFRWWP
jgi:nucleoside-diphosphate-sugar epimerase